MNRPEHQDIDGLADALEERAELEGLSNGFEISARRQLQLWGIRWSLGLALALLGATAADWLWWLPTAAAICAAISLGWIFAMRWMIASRIRTARSTIRRTEQALADLASEGPGT